jgi:hypothetical protein
MDIASLTGLAVAAAAAALAAAALNLNGRMKKNRVSAKVPVISGRKKKRSANR